MSKGKTPNKRYHNDVMGMPCFAAVEELTINVAAEHKKEAIPKDDQNCAIALGCRAQLRSPYVSVGRSRTDLALPHPLGVEKPGFGKTKWAVIRYKNSKGAREIIIAADTETLGDEGEMVLFLPTTHDNLPDVKRGQNKVQRAKPKSKKQSDSDELTEMGVRILTGQRRR